MNRCKACGADIIWIMMKTGRAMPCDAQKIPFRIAHHSEERAKVLVEITGKIAYGIYDPEGDKIGYTSHFATCPAAAQFRRS